jgi:hypothetical protein
LPQILSSDDEVALVEAGEKYVAKVDGPDAVVGLLQANEVLLERVGDEEQMVLEPEGAGVGHALDDEVGWIFVRIGERSALLVSPEKR